MGGQRPAPAAFFPRGTDLLPIALNISFVLRTEAVCLCPHGCCSFTA